VTIILDQILNICVVSSWIPSKRRPNFAPFVYNFAENLGRFDINVSVITPLEDGEESITHEDFMTIYRVKSIFPLFLILRLIGKIKPDIIHVQAPNFFSCSAIPAAKLRKIPIIATVHRAEVDTIANPTFFFRKHALARFNKIIAVSNYTKSLALKAGASESQINVIYNSCDERFFFYGREKNVLRKKLNFRSDDRIILFVGNLIRRKGLSLLMESLNLLRDKIPDFLALIVGEGEDLQNLKSMVNKYGLNRNVIFYGRISKTKLSDLCALADVFVLPSTSEGHSVALLEAMASGLPIVASDIEGNKESVEDGVNALLFKNANREELAEKLAVVLTDQKLKRSMSAKSSEMYLKKFSTKIQIDNYLKIYSSLLKKAQNSDT
jgi:glycosyltransferase involved in cell wall biosynthesis